MRQFERPGILLSAVLAALATAPLVYATEMSHGEMSAAIRSANYPCAHVQEVKSTGDEKWSVVCNSGRFSVSRDKDGNFTVTRTE